MVFRITYPEDFKTRVKALFPDLKQLDKWLAAGDETVTTPRGYNTQDLVSYTLSGHDRLSNFLKKESEQVFYPEEIINALEPVITPKPDASADPDAGLAMALLKRAQKAKEAWALGNELEGFERQAWAASQREAAASDRARIAERRQGFRNRIEEIKQREPVRRPLPDRTR
jgi:hypothetical protein